MKNFNEIYEEVVRSSKDELEQLRKSYLAQTVTAILLLVGVAVIWFFVVYFLAISEGVAIIALFVSFVLAIIMMPKPKNEYKWAYKEKVVKTFVEEYDKNLTYRPGGSIPSSIYMIAGFENAYDRYHSEDLIKGKIDNHEIMMGEVHTEREEQSTDSDGDTTTHYVTIFHGMFGNIEINNIYNGQMRIHSDKGKLAKLFGDKGRVEMDSSEFEKYFDVYGSDKIQVMQVLTSDIMEQMIAFRKERKIEFEITICRNQLYIRFHTGNMFEANIFKSSVDANTLKKVYDIINFTFDITRSFIKVSEDTQI